MLISAFSFTEMAAEARKMTRQMAFAFDHVLSGRGPHHPEYNVMGVAAGIRSLYPLFGGGSGGENIRVNTPSAGPMRTRGPRLPVRAYFQTF